MKLKSYAIILLIVMLTISLTACNSGKKIKDQLIVAYTKQAALKSYRFSGSADIHLGAAAMSNLKSDPLTASLLSVLQESKITWQGVNSTNPVHLEARFAITPKGSTQPLELPLLIKDNKMYFSIPAINQKDEFFTLNLPAKESGSLQKSDILIGQIMQQLLNGLSGKWFTEQATTVKSADGQDLTTILIQFEQKNSLELGNSALTKLPEIKELLKTSGMLNDDQNNTLQPVTKQSIFDSLKPSLQDMRLSKPGSIVWTIDQEGYVRSNQFDVDFTSGKNNEAHSIHIINQIDDINKDPKFLIEIPTKTKSFDDIINHK